ncbi:UNVERIFIED_CONTAM: ABC transporter G family member 5 [Sesamum angustifolium]|uniref:ABC transporter G family member 5 n=1 Tax=Sesamum angustifolium TaxID=2727405 RepID=A0AAW2NKZ3_9LAMI
MKKQGCEIEAIGINYTIYTHTKQIPPTGKLQKNSKAVQEQELQEVPRKAAAGESRRPRARQVLKDVNLTAKPWEILAIVGPSGAGKSSLLEILAGKLTPQSASIYVNHKPLDKARFKKLSGYVTQKDTLFPLLTVEETLRFSAKLRLCLHEPELSSRVKSLMQELGLSHVAGAVWGRQVRGFQAGRDGVSRLVWR